MKFVWWLLIVVAVVQLVPFGHSHTNPPAAKEPDWDSEQTASLFRRACWDCHSDQTTWPWYSNVAPVSWLIQRDVTDGRRHLNFSRWDAPQRHAKDIARQVKQGEMPPWFYLPMHPQARLSDAEKQMVISGAEKSLGPQAETEQPNR